MLIKYNDKNYVIKLHCLLNAILYKLSLQESAMEATDFICNENAHLWEI